MKRDGSTPHRAATDARDADLPAELAWIADLDVPAWITAEDRRVLYMNAQARVLLHCPDGPLSEPCHHVVAGRTTTGEPLCGPACRFRESVAEGKPIAPRTFRIEPKGAAPHEVRVIAIPVPDPLSFEVRLVHLAVVATPPSRVESFVNRVADRTPGVPEDVSSVRAYETLTNREREILELLAEDRSQDEIADVLGISYHTVRTHVQNALRKIDAHSVMEAVARLLTRTP